MMKLVSFLAGLCTFVAAVNGLGQAPVLTTTTPQNSSSLLQLAGSGTNGQILVSSDDWFGVLRAAEDLATDFGKVTGRNLTLANWNGGDASSSKRDARRSLVEHHITTTSGGETTVFYSYNPITNNVNYTTGPVVNITGPTLQDSTTANTIIIAGTIDKSSVINSLISSGKIDVSAITGQWESFISEVIDSPLPGVDQALVIAGSDLRGTVFGLYDVSEQIGVSPWYFFADVPVKNQSSVWALGGKKVQGSPSVKYRGIFINDEQPGLTNWINENYSPGKYGPGFNHFFYPHVFELLLRLRANYLWPAMWASMFNVDDYENQPLADAFGIVMGTSHTEPFMRATNEWGTFGSQYGGNGQWEYDTNNASLIPFFTYGAQRAAPYIGNSLITMAMRGSGDTAIDLTQAEAIQVLENVVAEQTKILGNVFNGTNVEDIPQMWCLYKEVQGYFEAGMTVPEYITLLWSDDNWGNLRRTPLDNETDRSGGAGIYYHVDYVGDPRDYKWINTIQLEKTVEQMQQAYQRQADRIWILNVGDLKPLEIPINHFLDLAYNTPQWGYDSVPIWLTAWATREFGAKLASDISSVVNTYGMYAARRKYELIDPTVYSLINYNEADTVLAQWTLLADQANAIYAQLDSASQPAFYEMILQPVLGGQVVHEIYIGAARNELYTEQKRNTANTVAQDVLTSFNKDHNLTQTYHNLLNGKWNHMLDQTHLGYNYWQQPMRNALPPLSWVQTLETSLAGNIGVSIEGSNATVSGDDMYHTLSSNVLTLPPMDPYGPSSRWIDIFARGTSSCSWNLSLSEPWVTATPSTGTTGVNSTDTRSYLTVDWNSPLINTTTITIKATSSCGSAWGNFGSPEVRLPINATSIPSNFTNGFVESDGHISIEAEHASENSTVNGIGYITLPNYGRTLSGVTLNTPLAPTQEVGTGPYLLYNLYTFTAVPNASITLYISPSLNNLGPSRPLKYAISLDSEVPQEIQFISNTTNGNLPTGWTGAVSDSIWGLNSGNSTTTIHDFSDTGSHELRIWAIEPGVVFQKVIINLGGVRQSYLGPPESFGVGDGGSDKGGGGYYGTNFTQGI